MKAFDQNSYHKQVLVPQRKKWDESGELPEEFTRYGLEGQSLDNVGEEELKAYLASVAAYWRNQAGKSRLAEFVDALLREHDQAQKEILGPDPPPPPPPPPPGDEILDALKGVVRDGVIPAKELRRINDRFGTKKRKEIEDVIARMGWRVEEAVEPTSLDVMKQIGRDLVKLCHIRESDGPTVPRGRERLTSLNLYGFLELMQDASESAIRQALGDREAEKARLGATSLKTCLGNLIQQVNLHLLIPAARKRYDLALIDEVAESTVGRVEGLAEDGELSKSHSGMLVIEAGRTGLTEKNAREAVRKAGLKAGVMLTKPGDAPVFVSCMACGISNPTDERFCRECGSELSRSCPSCSSIEPKSASNCGSCGYDFEGISRADTLEAEAALNLEEGRVVGASEKLKAASLADPGRPGLDKKLRDLESRLERARLLWEEVEVAIDQNRFGEVEDLVGQTLHQVSDFRGSSRNPTDAVAKKTQEAVLEAEKQVDIATRAGAPDARERHLAAALNASADCRRAIEGLASIEPLAPSEVRAQVEGDEIVVSWSPTTSPGPVRYSITSKSASGKVVETLASKELSIRQSLPAGTKGRYEVRTVRAGAVSKGAHSEMTVAVYPVVTPTISCDETSIKLGWKRIEGQRIKIVRSVGSEREVLGVFDDSSFEDRTARFGTNYRYELTPTYEDGPGRLQGARHLLDGKLIKKPEPVRSLSFEVTEAGLAIGFDGGAGGEVEVFRVTDDWKVTAGTDLDPSTYRALGACLPLAGDGRFLDRDRTPSAFSRYSAVSSEGPFRISGQPSDYLDLSPVYDLQIAQEGSVARLTWRWPEGVRQARVLARGGASPVGCEDPEATIQDVTLDHYQRAGGVTIDCAEGATHVAVYPVLSIDSRPACGSVAATASTDIAEREVRYSVEFSKRGKRLSVRADGDDPIPDLIFVGRSGSAPLQASSADEKLTSLTADRNEATIEVGKRRRPYFVRAFLEHPEDAPSVTVVHPSERKLRLE